MKGEGGGGKQRLNLPCSWLTAFLFPSFPHKYTFWGRAQPGKMQKVELTALGPEVLHEHLYGCVK